MRTVYKIIVLLVSVVLLPSALYAQEGNNKTPKGAKEKQAITRAEGDAIAEKLDFPEVEGWKRSNRITVPIEGGGYSINYDLASGSRVTVYVYSQGHDRIPDELKGVITEELEGATGAIRTVASMGGYSDVKMGKPETVNLGGEQGNVKVLRTSLTLTHGNEKMNSEIYVFPYKNNIVKLRVSRPAASSSERDAALSQLMSRLDQLFSH